MKPQILIVEDDFLVALAIQDVIEAAGYEVVGPYRRLTSAWDVARSLELSAAFLDIRIEGGTVFPVAKALQNRGIPFAFVTANPELITAKIYPEAPVISKPFAPSDVEGALERLVH
ncbi:MAG: response regulator [Tistlia sp.]|uniref:response regulator n=1 Tax=Tistlia sp. TaxID=3057121 RepID=UPI0034A2414E